MQPSKSINRAPMDQICQYHQDLIEMEWFNLPIKIIGPNRVKTIQKLAKFLHPRTRLTVIRTQFGNLMSKIQNKAVSIRTELNFKLKRIKEILEAQVIHKI